MTAQAIWSLRSLSLGLRAVFLRHFCSFAGKWPIFIEQDFALALFFGNVVDFQILEEVDSGFY
jgi:hypothetical protein